MYSTQGNNLTFLTLAAGTLLTLSAPSKAADSIMFGLWSQHSDSATKCADRYCNEENNLLGIEYGGYFLATYKNTLGAETWLAGATTEVGCWKFACLGAMYGLATGYEEKTGNEIDPFVVPRIEIQLYNNLHLQILGVPGYVTGVGFTYHF